MKHTHERTERETLARADPRFSAASSTGLNALD